MWVYDLTSCFCLLCVLNWPQYQGHLQFKRLGKKNKQAYQSWCYFLSKLLTWFTTSCSLHTAEHYGYSIHGSDSKLLQCIVGSHSSMWFETWKAVKVDFWDSLIRFGDMMCLSEFINCLYWLPLCTFNVSETKILLHAHKKKLLTLNINSFKMIHESLYNHVRLN